MQCCLFFVLLLLWVKAAATLCSKHAPLKYASFARYVLLRALCPKDTSQLVWNAPPPPLCPVSESRSDSTWQTRPLKIRLFCVKRHDNRCAMLSLLRPLAPVCESRSDSMWHTIRQAINCNTRKSLQHTATHRSILQHTATMGTRCNNGASRGDSMWLRTRQAINCNTRKSLQHTATHCSILQHTATHCNTLQHTATHCNTLQHTATRRTFANGTRHAINCNKRNSLQHTATHCNILQHTATIGRICQRDTPNHR